MIRTVLLSLLLLGGCSGESFDVSSETGGVEPSISSLPTETRDARLVVSPSFREVVVGRPLRLNPLLVSGANEVESLDPAELVWDSSDPGKATVDTTGLVSAVGSGRVTIRGNYRGTVATSYLVIRPVAEPSPPSPPAPLPSLPAGTAPRGEGSSSPEVGEGEAAPSIECDRTDPSDNPFADEVVSYMIGANGGFHEERLPEIVLGPPHAHPGAPLVSSYDVFSLGRGGQITLEFTQRALCDGEGADFIVFENPFQVGTDPENTFAEPGIVGVSSDGVEFVEFPCELDPPYDGCAGIRPVLANPDSNDLDPTDPEEAGGDPFDLAEIGVQSVRFIRIRDSGLGLGPIGTGTSGFDLDAVSVVNGSR